jgi:hypothetical protein
MKTIVIVDFLSLAFMNVPLPSDRRCSIFVRSYNHAQKSPYPRQLSLGKLESRPCGSD